MKRMIRGRRGVTLFAAVWAIGLAVIWWLTPVGPRDGWQPARGDGVCGFLPNSRTLVTVGRAREGGPPMDTREGGAVRLWNVENGQLEAAYFISNENLDEVS